MREIFDIDYTIGSIDKKVVNQIYESKYKSIYLSVVLQQVNNALRDMFLSSLEKENKPCPQRRRAMMRLLESAECKDINNTVIPYLSTQKQYKNNPQEKIDCFAIGFVNTLKHINTDNNSKKFLHEHLLYNRVLPINNLNDLCTLLERTISVRDWLRHKDTQKPSYTYIVATINLICIILPPSISKIYIDKINIDEFVDVWIYWSSKHKENMHAFFNNERSKKKLAKTTLDFKDENDENRFLARVNKKSREISLLPKQYENLYQQFNNSQNELKFWKFIKYYNFIGKVFIESEFEINKTYDTEKTKISFKNEILPMYTLYTKINFLLLDAYNHILIKTKQLEWKDVFKNINKEDKDKFNWINGNNPFKTIGTCINNISHNRKFDYKNEQEQYTPQEIFNDFLEVFKYLEMKSERAKFIQDFDVLFKQENYCVDKTTGAKLSYNIKTKKYYYNQYNKENSEKLGEKCYDKTEVKIGNIDKRKYIKNICRQFNNDLKIASGKFVPNAKRKIIKNKKRLEK